MAKKEGVILSLLTVLPWYWSVMISGIIYVSLTYLVPAIQTSNLVFQVFIKSAPPTAPFWAVLFLVPTPFALYNSWRKRDQYDRCKNMDSINKIDWQGFEKCVAKYYRRQEYLVQENFDKASDGGIDIRLRKDGQLHLVQCKHSKRGKVGISTIREMYGAMIVEIAASVIIVTSGSFTHDAKEFAFGKSIKLIDGRELEKMIMIDQPHVVQLDDSIGKETGS